MRVIHVPDLSQPASQAQAQAQSESNPADPSHFQTPIQAISDSIFDHHHPFTVPNPPEDGWERERDQLNAEYMALLDGYLEDENGRREDAEDIVSLGMGLRDSGVAGEQEYTAWRERIMMSLAPASDWTEWGDGELGAALRIAEGIAMAAGVEEGHGEEEGDESESGSGSEGFVSARESPSPEPEGESQAEAEARAEQEDQDPRALHNVVRASRVLSGDFAWMMRERVEVDTSRDGTRSEGGAGGTCGEPS